MYSRVQPWPVMMSKQTASAYLDLREDEFERAVVSGELPKQTPFLGGGRWSKDDLDAAIARALRSADKPAALIKSVSAPARETSLPGSDPKRLAAIGDAVRRQLEGHPGARQIPAPDVDIYAMESLVTASECSELIRLIDADLRPSAILSAAPDPGFRTSQTCYLPPEHPLVANLDKRFSELLGLPLSHSETVQGQRYTAGQHFKPHQDYFHAGQSWSEKVAREGGQRTWTAMVFLNEPDAGGCTDFPDVPVKIIPQTGKLLAWNNMGRDGNPNPRTRHEGTPVEAGTKYVITKWFREREWRAAPPNG
jgi:prolyl 4-hydroxylase